MTPKWGIIESLSGNLLVLDHLSGPLALVKKISAGATSIMHIAIIGYIYTIDSHAHTDRTTLAYQL